MLTNSSHESVSGESDGITLLCGTVSRRLRMKSQVDCVTRFIRREDLLLFVGSEQLVSLEDIPNGVNYEAYYVLL